MLLFHMTFKWYISIHFMVYRMRILYNSDVTRVVTQSVLRQNQRVKI